MGPHITFNSVRALAFHPGHSPPGERKPPWDGIGENRQARGFRKTNGDRCSLAKQMLDLSPERITVALGPLSPVGGSVTHLVKDGAADFTIAWVKADIDGDYFFLPIALAKKLPHGPKPDREVR